MDCKLSVLAVLLGVAAVVLSADEKSSTPATEAEGTIKIFRRLIPADVLRGKPIAQLFWPDENRPNLLLINIIMRRKIRTKLFDKIIESDNIEKYVGENEICYQKLLFMILDKNTIIQKKKPIRIYGYLFVIR